MKLIIVRHADPDYSIDSLTEKGWREAELLSERLTGLDVKAFYVSTMGRAKDTASLTLQKLGRTAIECDWLQEFNVQVKKPDEGAHTGAWDWLPQSWTSIPEFYSEKEWLDVPVFAETELPNRYTYVTEELDNLLKRHGYERAGRIYKAVNPNHDTIVLFCHFGVECVLLSHLLGISPMPLWHGFCALPSSVTTVVTEERRPGIASFRTLSFGDISHLYAKGEEPAFAARFSECYEDENGRLD